MADEESTVLIPSVPEWGDPDFMSAIASDKPVWCKYCSSEVTAELGPDGSIWVCPNCGHGLARTTGGSGLPSTQVISDAPLPERYEAAKRAVAECHRVDECKEWSDKAVALASYARQVRDHELVTMAQRINGRAVRRCGELLREADGRQGQNLPGAKTDGAGRFSPPFPERAGGIRWSV